jgi:hypothetical protein
MALGTVFFANLLLSFGVILFLAGLFGAYFGQGKSRSVGFVLSLVALLLLGLFAALTWELIPGLEPVFDTDTIVQSAVAVSGALLGTVVAVASFVAVVMRS